MTIEFTAADRLRTMTDDLAHVLATKGYTVIDGASATEIRVEHKGFLYELTVTGGHEIEVPEPILVEWEYGFYAEEIGPHPIIWYTFGGLVNFDTLASAQHTASKSVNSPIFVKRVKSQTQTWEHVDTGVEQ
jgi:hypothetical protein